MVLLSQEYAQEIVEDGVVEVPPLEFKGEKMKGSGFFKKSMSHIDSLVTN